MKRVDAAPLIVGLSVAGAAAVVASATTLADLASSAGWTGWTPWLLPASLDVGSAVAVWSWLRPGTPNEARKFARGLAVAGSGGTLVGNAVGHLIESTFMTSSPILVIAVGAAPAAMLVALAHLAALLVAQPTAAPTAGPVVPSEPATRSAPTPTEAPDPTRPQNQPTRPGPAPIPDPADGYSPPRPSAGSADPTRPAPPPGPAQAQPIRSDPIRPAPPRPAATKADPGDRVEGTDSELRSALERAIKVGKIGRPLTEASVLSVVVAGGKRARQLRDDINQQDQDATDGDDVEPERVSG